MMTVMRIIRTDYKSVLPLRHKVLWPEKPIDFCQVKGDESAWHFAVIDSDENEGRATPISVASIYFDKTSPSKVRLRKFATVGHLQGKGIGSLLLKHIINVLRDNKVEILWLDALAYFKMSINLH